MCYEREPPNDPAIIQIIPHQGYLKQLKAPLSPSSSSGALLSFLQAEPCLPVRHISVGGWTSETCSQSSSHMGHALLAIFHLCFKLVLRHRQAPQLVAPSGSRKAEAGEATLFADRLCCYTHLFVVWDIRAVYTFAMKATLKKNNNLLIWQFLK